MSDSITGDQLVELFIEGETAAKNGEPRSANPHAGGDTDPFNQARRRTWFAGWDSWKLDPVQRNEAGSGRDSSRPRPAP